VRGLASRGPTELCISVACSTVFNGRVVLLPREPIYPGTPKHNSVGKVRRKQSRTGGRNRHGERASHPLAQAERLSGPCSVNPPNEGRHSLRLRARRGSTVLLYNIFRLYGRGLPFRARPGEHSARWRIDTSCQLE
jgi:hypothetical protein